MGMNMISKGVQNVLDYLQSDFPDMDVIGISGNSIQIKLVHDHSLILIAKSSSIVNLDGSF